MTKKICKSKKYRIKNLPRYWKQNGHVFGYHTPLFSHSWLILDNGTQNNSCSHLETSSLEMHVVMQIQEENHLNYNVLILILWYITCKSSRSPLWNVIFTDGGAEEMDPYDMLEPVNILADLPKDFYDKIVSTVILECREHIGTLRIC